jgi:hypothetical protein
VSLGHVGIILGFDVARVARSCTDWYRLLAATRFAEITIKEDNMKLPP